MRVIIEDIPNIVVVIFRIKVVLNGIIHESRHGSLTLLVLAVDVGTLVLKVRSKVTLHLVLVVSFRG